MYLLIYLLYSNIILINYMVILMFDFKFPLGGIVLPLLGAVPDSAIIIVSGLKPNAQDELSVGMGYGSMNIKYQVSHSPNLTPGSPNRTYNSNLTLTLTIIILSILT